MNTEAATDVIIRAKRANINRGKKEESEAQVPRAKNSAEEDNVAEDKNKF